MCFKGSLQAPQIDTCVLSKKWFPFGSPLNSGNKGSLNKRRIPCLFCPEAKRRTQFRRKLPALPPFRGMLGCKEDLCGKLCICTCIGRSRLAFACRPVVRDAGISGLLPVRCHRLVPGDSVPRQKNIADPKRAPRRSKERASALCRGLRESRSGGSAREPLQSA